MNQPIFSVVIPIFNAERTVETTIQSLQSQSIQNWEALIVNDASKDCSATLVSAMASRDPRIRFFNDLKRTNPRGAAAARNVGIENAEGQYIAFLDADDLWLPEKLSHQHTAFLGGADIVFSSYRRIDPFGRDEGVVTAQSEVTWEDALAGNPIGCLTGAYRRERFRDARMPTDIWPEDYRFWLDLLRGGSVAVGLPEVLAEYRVTSGSASSNKLASAYGVWRILKEENISLVRRMYCFAGYISSSTKRRTHPSSKGDST
ncbi:glycosyltransferase family 2 protein [Sulfitobacter sp. R18_2]|uniref:glycosyltransferase family 2 protein n=1 Tax=Sulfitobacter sp. R18_2 TaxID=2821105 RepID=UPI001ADCC432|nr:glycosyltransferase family 2 protein [Sulfitobacter sp. R18_2]